MASQRIRFRSAVSRELGRSAKFSTLVAGGAGDPGIFSFIKKAARKVARVGVGLLPIPGAGVLAGLIPSGTPAPAFTPPSTRVGGPCFFLPSGVIKDACLRATGGLPPGPSLPFAPAGPTQLPPTGGNGVATIGAFGMPAASPDVLSTIRRRCGRGMVLGIDDLCYPKAVLTARSKFRKWRRPIAPPISRRDTVAIRRAASAKERVLELAKDVGLHVSKSRPTPRKKC